MRYWLLAAAATSVFTLLVHVIAGGRQVARPLLSSAALSDDVKFTHYLCWHLVTITLAMTAAAFGVAVLAGSRDVAVLAIAQAILFAAWNIVMVVRHRLRPSAFPQWTLFLTIAGLGAIGIWAR